MIKKYDTIILSRSFDFGVQSKVVGEEVPQFPKGKADFIHSELENGTPIHKEKELIPESFAQARDRKKAILLYVGFSPLTPML